MLGPESLAIAAGAIALGATVQGTAGFGMSLVAVPLLALVSTHLVPGPTLVASTALCLLVQRRERAHADLAGARWAILGLLPGTLVGALVIRHVSAHALSILVAVVVLAAVVVAAGPFRPRRWSLSMFGAGTASGFMGTTAGPGGPPVALMYADSPGPVVRATMNRVFIVSNAVSAVGLSWAGRFGHREIIWGLWLVPGAVAGFAISGLLHEWVDRRSLRPYVLGLSAASGLVLLATHL